MPGNQLASLGGSQWRLDGAVGFELSSESGKTDGVERAAQGLQWFEEGADKMNSVGLGAAEGAAMPFAKRIFAIAVNRILLSDNHCVFVFNFVNDHLRKSWVFRLPWRTQLIQQTLLFGNVGLCQQRFT